MSELWQDKVVTSFEGGGAQCRVVGNRWMTDEVASLNGVKQHGPVLELLNNIRAGRGALFSRRRRRTTVHVNVDT